MAKVWLITGASSGLGAALVKAVLAKGDKVAAGFRKPEAAAAFSSSGENCLGLVLDVTLHNEITAAVELTIKQFGTIDVLVNNAGYGTIGALEEFSLEEIRDQMETNFFGALEMTRAVLPIMRKNRSGQIVQISSQSGIRASAGFGLYNASKFALEGFSEALAQEVAPFGIKVLIVEPGPFRTKFLGSSVKPAKNKMPDYEGTAVSEMYLYMERMNGKQEGDPEKGAKAVVDYVNAGSPHLRLPLGKLAVQGIRAKLSSVEKDVAANEAIANSAVFV